MQNSRGLNSTKDNLFNGKSETISELAHRHLTDENHTTSDEEMKNAKVELSENGKGDEGNMPEGFATPNKVQEEGNDAEDLKSERSSFPNPYDVVSF